MTERHYQMIRVAAGDYLLPSNDRLTLWRIYSYVEDGSAEYRDADGWHKIVGTFWAIAKYPKPIPEIPPHEIGDLEDDFLSRERWIETHGGLRTRREALEAIPHGETK